jgi:hypothetical protein
MSIPENNFFLNYLIYLCKYSTPKASLFCPKFADQIKSFAIITFLKKIEDRAEHELP